MTARKYDSRRFGASATLASLVGALAFLSASAILIPQAQETALDRYVNSKRSGLRMEADSHCYTLMRTESTLKRPPTRSSPCGSPDRIATRHPGRHRLAVSVLVLVSRRRPPPSSAFLRAGGVA